MRTPRINLSFSKYSDANLEAKAGVITSNLSASTDFPNLTPPIATVKQVLDEYSAALLAAANRARENVAVKNAARAALQAILRQLGISVMTIANGSIPLLTQSGFTLSKVPERNYIENPGAVKLVNGRSSGQLISSVKKVDGARSYVHELATEEPAETTIWKGKSTSTVKYIFNGLTPGKKYWVRVSATGSDNQTTYSPVASIFVQ